MKPTGPRAGDVMPVPANGTTAKSGACALSTDGTVVWSSAGDHPLFGPDGGQAAIGGSFLQYWVGPDRAGVAQALEDVQRFGRGHCVARPSSGEMAHLPVDVALELRRGDGTRAAELLVSLRARERSDTDVEYRKLQAALSISEQKCQILADAIRSPISFLDGQRRYVFANPSYKAWFGWDPAAITGSHLREVLGSAAYEIVKDHFTRAMQGERLTFERHMPHMVGPLQHLQIELIPQVSDGAVLGCFVVISDVSERKEPVEVLRKSGEQLRTLFEHLPVGAALVDSSGSVTLENDVFMYLMPSHGVHDSITNIFTRAYTLLREDGSLLKDEDHPVRRALSGEVVRNAEFLCRYEEGRQMWVRISSVPVRDEHANISGALVVMADIHVEKRADARRTLLVNELNHRVKNTLASVQSIASQTFRESRLTEDGLDAFESRLLALSEAHNLLTRENWESVDLKQLALLVLEPHDPGFDRLQIGGARVRLRPAAGLAFAMALHELATNAVKYGALSNARGTVRLKWDLTGPATARRLQLSWVERGGPQVVEPERKGFGSRLIERSLAFELASDTTIEFQHQGVVCRIDASLAEIGG